MHAKSDKELESRRDLNSYYSAVNFPPAFAVPII